MKEILINFLKQILIHVLAGLVLALMVAVVVYGGVEAYAVERTGTCAICMVGWWW